VLRPQARPATVRLGLSYAAFFAVIGVQQPFWPLWLAAHGLSATDIGVVLAVSIGIKVVSTPAVAHLADRSGERKRLTVLFAALAIAAYALFHATQGFWPILLVSLVFFALWPPIVSLTESMTMLASRQGRADYGRARLWGSLSYIATAALAGRALTLWPPSSIYWMAAAALIASLLACLLAPDLRAEPSRSPRLPLLDVLRDRRFVAFLAACGLIHGSHAVYYGFATLHWQAAGYSPAVIGALWAEGVLAEVVLFAFGARVLRRLNPLSLAAIAGLACVVRWLGTGLTDALPALIALQALHAFSFGAAHLAAMHHITDTVAPALSATAQSLYSGLVWGLFLGLMMFAAGLLYARLGGHAFLPMAALGAAATVIAWQLQRSR
jgi:PPP family 3-phenylpropionic acid transporter